MTVGETLTQFGYFKQDISDVSQPTFLQWANIVNRYAYRIMYNIDPDRFILEVDYTTASQTGPDTQALPADFESILPWNTGFFFLDNNGNMWNQRLIKTSPSNQVWGYYLQGSNAIFTSPQARTYKLRYIPRITALTSLADVLVIPDQYEEYIIKALDVLYEQWDQNPNQEAIADQRFVRVLQEFAADIKKDPMSFDMPDFSGSFTNSGGGSGFGYGWWW